MDIIFKRGGMFNELAQKVYCIPGDTRYGYTVWWQGKIVGIAGATPFRWYDICHVLEYSGISRKMIEEGRVAYNNVFFMFRRIPVYPSHVIAMLIRTLNREWIRETGRRLLAVITTIEPCHAGLSYKHAGFIYAGTVRTREWMTIDRRCMSEKMKIFVRLKGGNVIIAGEELLLERFSR